MPRRSLIVVVFAALAPCAAPLSSQDRSTAALALPIFNATHDYSGADLAAPVPAAHSLTRLHPVNRTATSRRRRLGGGGHADAHEGGLTPLFMGIGAAAEWQPCPSVLALPCSSKGRRQQSRRCKNHRKRASSRRTRSTQVRTTRTSTWARRRSASRSSWTRGRTTRRSRARDARAAASTRTRKEPASLVVSLSLGSLVRRGTDADRP